MQQDNEQQHLNCSSASKQQQQYRRQPLQHRQLQRIRSPPILKRTSSLPMPVSVGGGDDDPCQHHHGDLVSTTATSGISPLAYMANPQLADHRMLMQRDTYIGGDGMLMTDRGECPPPPAYSDLTSLSPMVTSQVDSPTSSTYVQLTPRTSNTAITAALRAIARESHVSNSLPRLYGENRGGDSSHRGNDRGVALLAEALRQSLARLDAERRQNLDHGCHSDDGADPEAEIETGEPKPLIGEGARSHVPGRALTTDGKGYSLPVSPCLPSTPMHRNRGGACGEHCLLRNSPDVILSGFDVSSDGGGVGASGGGGLATRRSGKMLPQSPTAGMGSLGAGVRSPLLRSRQNSFRQHAHQHCYVPLSPANCPAKSNNPTIMITAESDPNSILSDYLCSPEASNNKLLAEQTLFIGDDVSLYGTPKEELSPLRVSVDVVILLSPGQITYT
jgi:hypothetical protein